MRRSVMLAVVVSLSLYAASFLFGWVVDVRMDGVLGSYDPLSWASIFGHNVVALVVLLSGALLAGIPTAVSLVLQGLSHGVSLSVSAEVFGAYVLWVVPHGIVELVAITAGGVVGFVPILQLLRSERTTWRCLVFVAVATVPILAVSALIEVVVWKAFFA